MDTVLHNNNIILNIISFLIDPPVLITGYYYNNGNLDVICDKNYSKNYYENEIKKYISAGNGNDNTFYNIIQNVLINNKEYLINGNIYFTNEFIFNNWANTYLFELDNSAESFSNYRDKFYIFLKNNVNTVNIWNYNNISDYLEIIKYGIINHNNYIKISELQFRIRYISMYFKDYLILNNHDLKKFNVKNIISFIRTEETILHNFIL